MNTHTHKYFSFLIVLVLLGTLLLGACSNSSTELVEETTSAPTAVEESATTESGEEETLAEASVEEPTAEQPDEVEASQEETLATTEEETSTTTETEQVVESTEELPDGTGLRVATIWGSLGNLWNVEGHKAAVAALEEMGVEVLDSNAGGDRNRQVDLIENAIQLQVDGMLMGDVALEIIDPVIKEAADAGIPTVSILAYSQEAINDVSMDEFLVGIQQAHETQKYLGDKPGNIVVAFEPGYRPLELRYAAWEMAMPFLAPEFNVVATVNAHWPNTMPEAKAQMEALLRQYGPGEIDVAYATYDLEAIGMAQAIEEAGRDEIVVIAADGGDVLDWLARDSVVKSTIVMDPQGAGRQAAINLVNYLLGETLEPATYWPSYVADLDNYEQFIKD